MSSVEPELDQAQGLQDYAQELIDKLRMAARVKVRVPRSQAAPISPSPGLSGDAFVLQRPTPSFRTTDRVLAIGASTGGTEAIKEVLLRLPPDTPGVIIAQHIPPGFSAAFAERMNRQTGLVVKEAADGDRVMMGHAYIAPGNRHLLLARDGARYVCI